MNRIYCKETKDLTRLGFWGAVVLLLAVRLVLAAQGRLYLVPENSPIDDQLMYNAAVSITSGSWLGEYAYNTMAKMMFFSVWLAFIHWAGLPYLIANALLGTAAALFMAAALSPVLKKRLWVLGTFFVLAFCPVNFDAFNYRVYRDSITVPLLLLTFGGVIGFVLRWLHPGTKHRGSCYAYAVIGGLGLGAGWLNREDGIWLLPFCVCFVLVGFAALCKTLRGKKAGKTICRAVGCCAVCGLVAAGCLAAYAGMNYKTYGRFILSDLTSKDFTTAYGLLTGIEDEGTGRYRPITRETRQKLYENSDFFAALEPYWENATVLNGYGDTKTGEYGGSFYYGLRLANQFAGQYTDALQTKAFYEEMAAELLRLEQAGVITISHKWASTLAVWKSEYLLPTLQETGSGIKMALWMPTFDPTVEMTLYDSKVQQLVEQMQAYLRGSIVAGYRAGTDQPYLNLLQRAAFAGERVLAWGWRILILPAAAVAVWCAVSGWGRYMGWLFGTGKKHPLRRGAHLRREMVGTEKEQLPRCSAGALPQGFAEWLLLWGLLLSGLLRCGIMAYMEVTAFGIGTYLMYLSTAVPLFGLAGVLGVCTLLRQRAQTGKKQK